MARSNETNSDAHKKYRAILRWILAVFVTGILVSLAFNVSAQFSLSGKPTIDLLILGGLANLSFYIFVRTNASWSRSRQVGLLSLIALLQIAGCFSLKLDGLYGNGYPKIVWRWTTKPADRVFVERTSKVVVASINQTRWPGFRGKNCSGIVEDIQLEDWNISPPRLIWAHPIGGGWSSFAMAGNVCVTHEQRGDDEFVVCYELATGDLIWEHRDRARFQEVSSGEGPRATPTIAGEYVYSFGATGILNCIQLSSGNLVWSREVLEENNIPNRLFGMAGSPLVVDDNVIVAPGGDKRSVIMYDRFDGREKWTSGNEIASYCSPQFEVICAMPSILSFNGEGLSCFRLSDGTRVFHVPWVSNPSEKNNVCQPIVLNTSETTTRIFLSSGYGKGSAVYQITRDSNDFIVTQVWANKNLKSKFASAVSHQNLVYGLDNGILACLDSNTGKRLWKGGRYGHGQLIRIGKTLLVQSEKGYVARVGCSTSELVEESRLKALGTRTWNHPAFSGKYLLLRNDRKAMCFELTLTGESENKRISKDP